MQQTPPSIQDIIDTVDQDRWFAARDRWISDYEETVERGDRPDRLLRHAYNYAKYFELSPWIRYHLRCALQLRLDTAPAPLKILDIGCGSGIFPFVCNYLGHHAEGIDIESPMYFEMAEILGIKIRDYTVKPLTPLPEDIQGFDLFSAVAIKFDRDDFGTNSRIPWNLEEWRFFVQDLANRLNPGGRLYIKPNLTSEVNGFHDEAIIAYLSSVSLEVAEPMAFVISREKVLET